MDADSLDPVVVEDQRRSLTRVYLIAAVVVLDLLALVGGIVYRRVSVSRIASAFEGRAVAVAQRFAATVWPDVSGWAAGAGSLDPAALRASPEVDEIGQGLAPLLAGLNVVDAEVYAEDGTVIYATRADRIGSTATDAVVTDLLAGRYYNGGRLNAHTAVGTLPAPSGMGRTPRTFSVVTTDVAIRGTGFVGVEGVLSLSHDATSEIHDTVTVTVIGVVGVIAMSAVFLALVLYIMRPRRPQKGE